MKTTMSLTVSVLTPFAMIGFLLYNIGYGNGTLNMISIAFIIPSLISATTAWIIRKNSAASTILLIGILFSFIYQMAWVYLAFYATPAQGGNAVIFRPIEMTILLTVIAIGLLSWVGIQKLGVNRRK